MDAYNVLFVDDEPFILKAMMRLFRGDQMNILTAPDGENALEIVKSRCIQVVVTDNIMPGMSGVELVRKIKECSPNTVRIILSGHSDMDAVLKAINEGEAYRFVMKPWHDLDMKATVHLALAQYRLTEQNLELISEIQAQRLIVSRLRKRFPEVYVQLLADVPGADDLLNPRSSAVSG